MHQKSSDVLRRSDRVLVAALIVVIAAVSAAVGAAAAYRPHAEQLRTTVAMAKPSEPASPSEGGVAMASDVALPASSRFTARSVSEQLIMNKLLAEHRCLAEALYFEARGEGVEGEKAVAEVIFHRMRTGDYGHSICAVVYEGAGEPGCQFSFTCNGDLAERKQPAAWMQAQVLAARILTGEEHLGDITDGATSFHAVSVQPDWAAELQKTVQIGNHIFYKDPSHSRQM